MSPIEYDPKRLTESMELDYFRRPRWLTRLLRLACWAALFASLGFVAYAAVPRHQAIYQGGPLSTAHHLFRNDCGQCHTEAFRTAARLLPGGSEVRSVADETCKQCHEGPRHTPSVEAVGCAGCHAEHRGKPSLARVSDGQCTVCHASKVVEGHVEIVRSFAAHPQFALWRTQQKDPGTVRFNHHVHLTLPSEKVLRLREQFPDRAGRLGEPFARLRVWQCGYCHQADSTGRYMRPIRYEQHCADCHPLQVQVVDVPQEGPVAEAARQFALDPVPHPAAPQEGPATVRAVLRERYLKFAQQHARWIADVKTPQEPPRPLPGLPRGEPATESQLDWVNRQLHQSEATLLDGADGCRRCHQEVGTRLDARPDGLPSLGKPFIPARWLNKSVFRHDSHRMLDCLACHEGPAASTSKDTVLLPRIEKCQECHNARVGARTDCAECHTYHQRPGPDPQHERPAPQLWRGTRRTPSSHVSD